MITMQLINELEDLKAKGATKSALTIQIGNNAYKEWLIEIENTTGIKASNVTHFMSVKVIKDNLLQPNQVVILNAGLLIPKINEGNYGGN